MNIIQFITQPGFLLIYVTIIVLIALVLFIYLIFQKEKEFQTEEKKGFSDYKKILKQADARARSIMDRAVVSSANLLDKNEQTNEHIEENLDAVLQHIAAKQINTINKESEQTRKEYEAYLKSIVSQIHDERDKISTMTQQHLDQSFQEFTKALQQTTATMQKSLDNRMETLFAQAQNEITAYKTLQMQAVDKQVTSLIEKTYEKVLRKTLPDAVHHDLIMQAFEEAKSESLFTL
jgi:hypothetical protein